MPGRSLPTEFLAATTLLFLIVLTGGDKVYSEQRGAEQSDDQRRTHGSKNVGDSVGDRHRVQQVLSLIGSQVRAG